jgi:hypothetical protein
MLDFNKESKNNKKIWEYQDNNKDIISFNKFLEDIF